MLTPWTEARYHAIDVLKAFRKGDEEAAARAGKLARSALETYAGRPEGTSVQ